MIERTLKRVAPTSSRKWERRAGRRPQRAARWPATPLPLPSPRHPAGKHRPPNRGLTAKLSRSDFAPLLLVPASNFESMVSSSADIIGDEITIDTRLSHFELAPWVVAAWHSSAGAYTEQSQSSTTNHIKMRDENRYQKWNKNKTKKMSQKKATKKGSQHTCILFLSFRLNSSQSVGNNCFINQWEHRNESDDPLPRPLERHLRFIRKITSNLRYSYRVRFQVRGRRHDSDVTANFSPIYRQRGV